jgi:type IV pilus assembly protein PilA
MRTLRANLGRDEGFTLVELLVVILIIGVLAAIAIPSFLDQSHKAVDATAKEVARAASQAAETYETDHAGNYGGITTGALHELDHSLQVAEGSNNAYLTTAEEYESGQGYVVTATAPTTKDTFTITRTGNGEFLRTCTGSKTSGGCRTGTW